MSGIAGIVYRDGQSVRPEQIERMMNAQSHRGPDGSGVWRKQGVVLGHQMLHTTPESCHEMQPLASTALPYTLVADARIDNRKDLIRLLEVQEPHVITDADLILKAYAKWGSTCVKYLVGDFAFAIWDEAAQELFCARDPIGIKPFYYFHRQHCFAFASEARALLSLEGITDTIDDLVLAQMLTTEFVYEKERTVYNDVKRLPAGHALSVTDAGSKKWQYWRFDDIVPESYDADEAYAERFRELFTQAVRCCVRSTHPVGSFLSGGLDSSSVVCTAAGILEKVGEEPIHTFSAVYPSFTEADLRLIDEREYIQAVVESCRCVPHYVRADLSGPLADLRSLFNALGQFQYGTNIYIHRGVYDEAHRAGVRVLLDGLDGDTVVSHGREYLPELIQAGDLETFLSEAEALGEKENIPLKKFQEFYGYGHLDNLGEEGKWMQFLRDGTRIHRVLGLPWKRVFMYHGMKHLVPAELRQLRRRIMGETETGEEVLGDSGSLLRKEWRERLMEQAVTNNVGKELSPAESRWHGITKGIWQQVMELNDPLTAVRNIEPRSPFFDRRLMEFCIYLPSGQSLKDGWTRSVLRRAMEGILPPEVQWRTTKSDVSPGFVQGLLKERNKMEKALLEDPEPISHLIEIDYIRDAYQRFTEHPMAARNEAMEVFAATCLWEWLKYHRESLLTSDVNNE